MNVRHHTDGSAFLERAGPWLRAAETEHCLMLGIAAKLVSGPSSGEASPYLATVEASGEILACALRTPPHKLVLSRSRPEALEALIEDCLSVYGSSLPAVLGPIPEVDRFAEFWSARTGVQGRTGTHQRVFACRTVSPGSTQPPGGFRPAAWAELDRVIDWIVAFRGEIGVFDPHDDVREEATGLIRRGDLHLWVDRQPVAMAASALRPGSGIFVNHVYTPPDQRGRGYATACVRALTSHLLGTGFAYCALFTDVTNPTSNSIYQAIGYRPVCDMRDVLF